MLACSVASDCVRGIGSRSYLLGYQSAHPFRSHSPRPIDTGNGENGGANFVLVLGAGVRSVYPFDCVGTGDGGDCVSHLDVLDCLPAILRLPGNTSTGGSGRHAVGSRSGSIASLPASYPMWVCILSPYCPAPLPRAVSSVPFPCLLRSHRLTPSPIIRRGAPCCFRPSLIAHHAPPLVSDERDGFSKRIEFDAFKIVAMKRRLPAACLLAIVLVPCCPSAHPIISSNTPRSPCLSPSNPITGSACGRRSRPNRSPPITPPIV